MKSCRNEILNEVSDIRKTITIIENRTTTLEQAREEKINTTTLAHLSSELESLRLLVLNLQENIQESQASVSKSLIEREKFGQTVFSLSREFESLHSLVLNLQATVHGNQAPTSHRLAESVSGIIGLKEAIMTKRPMFKYIWMFLFCFGIGATIFFTCATAKEYFSEPTYTKVTVKNKELSDFPPIVLCNQAWFDTKKALNLGLTTDALQYFLAYLEDFNTVTLSNVTKARQNFLDVYNRHNFTGLIDYFKAVSVDLVPTFSKQDFHNSTSPSFLFFDRRIRVEKIFMNRQFICHSFYLPPINWRFGLLAPQSIGIKYGDKSAGLVSLSDNWKVHLSNDSTSMFSWPLSIRPSTTTVLTVKVTKFVSLTLPEVPCVADGNPAICISECANRILKDEIGCQLLEFVSGNSLEEPYKFCNFIDYPVHEILVNKTPIIVPKVEACHCPQRCEKLLYEATVLEEGPFFDAAINLKSNKNSTRKDMSVTQILIMHGALHQGGIVTYEEISNYSFVELINNIGGTLGLFVGGTVLTLAQLILFFANYICDKQKKDTATQDVAKGQ